MAQYMVEVSIQSENRNEIIKRFSDGAALELPAGAKLVGRWHAPGQLEAWNVVEADDPKGVYDWLLNWNDICDTRVIPVITDEETGDLIQKHGLG